MSAKRRQEAIARFSVPLEDVAAGNETLSQGRTLRRARNAMVKKPDSDENAGDGDFTMDGADNDSDDDFVDGPQLPFSQKKNMTKGKGRASVPEFDPSEENPRVMLLSLKAVSCD